MVIRGDITLCGLYNANNALENVVEGRAIKTGKNRTNTLSEGKSVYKSDGKVRLGNNKVGPVDGFAGRAEKAVAAASQVKRRQSSEFIQA